MVAMTVKERVDVMEIHQLLAINIKNLRKKKGLTQEDLGNLTGLHRTYIGGVEQARINLSLKNIDIIARALDVSPARLLENTTNNNGNSLDDLPETNMEDPNVSIHILTALVQQGYTGEDLTERFRNTKREIVKWVDEENIN